MMWQVLHFQLAVSLPYPNQKLPKLPQIWNINLETIISIVYHSKPLRLIFGTFMYYNWIVYDDLVKLVKVLDYYNNCDGNNDQHCF